MGLIVVDASVAVKWILSEPGSEEALAILDGVVSLAAPDLIQVEVAGAIARQGRDQRLSTDSANLAYAAWTRLLEHEAIVLRPTDALVDRAFEMAVVTGHSVADCVYLACAELLNATVLTADIAMHERGRRVYPSIQLLAKAA
jgi:predicted nucleic acid-binding protein